MIVSLLYTPSRLGTTRRLQASRVWLLLVNGHAERFIGIEPFPRPDDHQGYEGDADLGRSGGELTTALVQRARGGDQVAFAELFAIHVDRCYAIAYRILRDVGRSEDAVQQALMLAWRDLPSLRDPDRFEAWLTRLLVNQCYQSAARHRRWTSHVRELPEFALSQANDYLAIEQRDALERAFATLTPEQRAVIVLHHHAGLSLGVIAETLGVPLGTVKSRLHYATRLLRTALTADLASERRGTA